MDDPELLLLDRVAAPGEVVEVEPVYSLTDEAMAYLASGPTEFAAEADARG